MTGYVAVTTRVGRRGIKGSSGWFGPDHGFGTTWGSILTRDWRTGIIPRGAGLDSQIAVYPTEADARRQFTSACGKARAATVEYLPVAEAIARARKEVGRARARLRRRGEEVRF